MFAGDSTEHLCRCSPGSTAAAGQPGAQAVLGPTGSRSSSSSCCSGRLARNQHSNSRHLHLLRPGVVCSHSNAAPATAGRTCGHALKLGSSRSRGSGNSGCSCAGSAATAGGRGSCVALQERLSGAEPTGSGRVWCGGVGGQQVGVLRGCQARHACCASTALACRVRPCLLLRGVLRNGRTTCRGDADCGLDSKIGAAGHVAASCLIIMACTIHQGLLCWLFAPPCRLDGRKYAVKKIRLQPGGSSSSYSRILREVATLSRLQHPNVVRYYQVSVPNNRLVGSPTG